MQKPWSGDYFSWARNPFASMSDYLWGVYGFIGQEVKSGQGMLRFQQNCLGPAEQVAKLEALAAALEDQGLADTKIEDADGHLTVGIGLELHTLYVMARHFGASPHLFARAETLSSNTGADIEFFVTSRLTGVQRAAEGWERRAYDSLGMTDEEVLEDLGRLADGDLADLPRCKALGEQLARGSADTLERLASNPKRTLSAYDRLGVKVARRFGCIAGHTGDMETVAEAYGFVAAAPTHARPDRAEDPACVKALEKSANASMPDYPGFDTDTSAQMMYATMVLRDYYSGVVSNQCVEVPWTSAKP